MNRDTQGLLVLLTGAALVRIGADDTLLRYVRAWMRPGLLAAGVVLVLLGLVSLRQDRHGHAGGPWSAWLLLLPVLAIVVVAPPALGAYTAGRAVTTVARPASTDFPPLAHGDPVGITLTDFAMRAVWDRGRTLAGRRVRMVGFVSPRSGGGFHLTRIAVTCCAADARAIRVAVPGGRSFPADSWVAVTGTYAGLEAHAVPVLRAGSAEPVPAPAEPYEP